MEEKIKVTIRIGGKDYVFVMTNHMTNDGTLTGYDKHLQTIIDCIRTGAEDFQSSNDQIVWFIGEDIVRMWPIEEGHPLYNLLRPVDKKKGQVWLLFKGHPLYSKSIKITHFGPLGITSSSSKWSNWRDKNRDFKNDTIIQDIIERLKNCKTGKETKQAETQLKNHISQVYIRTRAALHSDVETAKAALIDIVKVVFGTTEVAAVVTANLGVALAPTALKVSGKLLLKETFTIITKQLAKEIAIITAKAGGKETGKVVGKKIPGIGLAIGAGLGLWRACKGDMAGAVLEVASGAASTLPGLGTASSLAIDGLLALKDVNEALRKLKHYEFEIGRMNSELGKIIDKISELDRKYELVMDTFFRGSFDFESNPSQFVEAFFVLLQHFIH